jgi:hypothetical protein
MGATLPEPGNPLQAPYSITEVIKKLDLELTLCILIAYYHLNKIYTFQRFINCYYIVKMDLSTVNNNRRRICPARLYLSNAQIKMKT